MEVAASPTTRLLALRNGVDIDALASELDADVVTRRDVERKLAEAGSAAAAAAAAAATSAPSEAAATSDAGARLRRR